MLQEEKEVKLNLNALIFSLNLNQYLESIEFEFSHNSHQSAYTVLLPTSKQDIGGVAEYAGTRNAFISDDLI